MAIKALDLSKKVIYESKRDPDKGKPEATKFSIGAIPSRVLAQIKDKATTYSADPNNTDNMTADFSPNMIAYDIVRHGLKGIENFDVDFKSEKDKIGTRLFDVVHTDVMEALDLETIRELSVEIQKICEIDGEEEKNLEG